MRFGKSFYLVEDIIKGDYTKWDELYDIIQKDCKEVLWNKCFVSDMSDIIQNVQLEFFRHISNYYEKHKNSSEAAKNKYLANKIEWRYIDFLRKNYKRVNETEENESNKIIEENTNEEIDDGEIKPEDTDKKKNDVIKISEDIIINIGDGESENHQDEDTIISNSTVKLNKSGGEYRVVLSDETPELPSSELPIDKKIVKYDECVSSMKKLCKLNIEPLVLLAYLYSNINRNDLNSDIKGTIEALSGLTVIEVYNVLKNELMEMLGVYLNIDEIMTPIWENVKDSQDVVFSLDSEKIRSSNWEISKKMKKGVRK